MIAALIAASFFYHSVAGPIKVRWRVRWSPPLVAETHARRFKTPTEAVEFASHAPMCEELKEAPCVEWIRVRFVEVEPWVMEARQQ